MNKNESFLVRCGKELPAFAEMCYIIKSLVMVGAGGKMWFRQQAKLRMLKAPTLTLSSLATVFLLFLFSLLMATTTKWGFFCATTVILMIVMGMITSMVLVIYTTKLPEGITEKAFAAPSDSATSSVGKDEETGPSNATMPSRRHNHNDDDAPAKRPTASVDVYCKWAGIGLSATIGIVVVYALLDNPATWMGVLFVILIMISTGILVNNAVSIYILAFVDKDRVIPKARVKVLRMIFCIIVELPFLFPAYGVVKGAYEVLTSERNGSQYSVNMFRYEMTCANMNWFSRLGYRWSYHFFLDFKEDTQSEDRRRMFSSRGNLFSANDSEEMNDTISDVDCVMEISTALMQNNLQLARQWAFRIKDERQRRYQLAVIENQEKLQSNLRQLQNSFNQY